MKKCKFSILASVVALLFCFSAKSETFKLYDLPAPDYPQECLEKSIEGTVMLALSISVSGQLEGVRVISAPATCPAFATAALTALKKAKFYGAHGHHKFTAQTVTVPVVFSINSDS